MGKNCVFSTKHAMKRPVFGAFPAVTVPRGGFLGGESGRGYIQKFVRGIKRLPFCVRDVPDGWCGVRGGGSGREGTPRNR